MPAHPRDADGTKSVTDRAGLGGVLDRLSTGSHGRDCWHSRGDLLWLLGCSPYLLDRSERRNEILDGLGVDAPPGCGIASILRYAATEGDDEVSIRPVAPTLPELRVVTAQIPAERALAEVARVGAGDGLPLRRPTPERVTAMLAGRDPAQTVPALPPLLLPATVEDVATCAVLAGCAPPALPYLVAALAAATAPEFNLLGVTTTTGNAAVGVVVHDADGDQLVPAVGHNCLGTAEVNTALGRALALACRLLGGALAGSLDMATVGQPAKLTLCTAEGAAPEGWTQLHVARGMRPGSAAVTVFATSGILEIADTESDSAAGLLGTLAAAIPLPAAIHSAGDLLGGGQQLLVLPPEWAGRLASDGWSRESIGEFLYDRAVLPVDRLPTSGRSRITDEVAAQGLIRTARSPADFLVVVAGGVGMKAAYLPSWPGGSMAVTAPVG